MKPIFSILRTALFVVIEYYTIYSIFWVANWFWFKVDFFLKYLQEKTSWVVVGLLLIFILGSMIVFLWRLLKIGAVILQRVVMRLTPYRTFAYWCTVVLVSLQALSFLYGYWFFGGSPQTFWGYLMGIVYSYIILSLSFLLLNASYKTKVYLEARDYNRLVDEFEQAKLDLNILRTKNEISYLERKIQEIENQRQVED